MARLYTNNYSSTLNGAITSSATSIVVTSASGLPTLSGGDTCSLTMTDGTNIEIVQVTAISTNTLTVVRAQESTTGFAFADGDVIQLNATAASFTSTTTTTPAFAAYHAAFQNVDSATPTLISYGTEEFDTTSDYSSNRFTPSTAGKYQVNATIGFGSLGDGKFLKIYIYKNGGAYRAISTKAYVTGEHFVQIADIVELNGSTDYVEIYAEHDQGSALTVSTTNNGTFFSSSLVA